MTIKPVGRPLPAIPIKRPYGSVRPGLPPPPPPPPPGFVSSGPPPEVIYGAGSAPHPPSLFGPPSGLIGSYPGFKKPGSPAFSSKPVYETGSLSEGFDFESNSQFIDKKQIALRPSVGSDAVQQHVHHHYHHSDGATIAGGSSLGASPIGQGVGSLSYGSSYGNVGTSYDIPNSGVFGGGFQDLDDYKKAFKVKGPGGNEANGFGSASASSYADKYPVYEKPTRDFAYTKTESHKTGKYFTAGNYVAPNAVHASSNDYLASGSTNNFLYGNGNENDAFKNDFSASHAGECVCIPYEQCPREQAGRKDDLFLPIDPRNLNKNIEAEGIIAAEKNGANETSTVVQIAKNGEVDSNASQISAEEEQSTEERADVRNKREATSDESIEGRKKSNGEGVRAVRNSLLNFSRLNILRIVSIKPPQHFQVLKISLFMTKKLIVYY